MTRQEIIDAAYLEVTGSKPSDDDELEKDWMKLRLDSVRSVHMKQYVKQGRMIPASALERFDCLAVELDTPECLSSVTPKCYARYFVQLPTYKNLNGDTVSQMPLQLARDKGIYRVTRAGGGIIDHYPGPGEGDILNKLPFARSSAKNEASFRIKDKLYLVGTNFENVKILIDIVLGDTGSISDTDNYPIPDDLIDPVIENLVHLCRIMLGMESDYKNDGKPAQR